MASPKDQAFDILVSVPTPRGDLATYFRRVLSSMHGCIIREADGTYHARVRLVVIHSMGMDAKDVRGAVTDTLRLRAPDVTVIGVRPVASAA